MNIAIVRRNGLGDLLCAFPLVLYIQKYIPEATISLFVDTRNAPLIPYLPPVNHVIVFPQQGNKYWRTYKTALKYKEKFDIAISAKTSPMKLTNFFLYWLKAKERIAYVDQSWHRFLINRPIEYKPEVASKKHQALKGLQTIAPLLNEVPEEFYPTLHVSIASKQRYGSCIDKNRLILVTATTTKPSNRLEPTRYANLLNQLHKKYSFHVLVVGQRCDEQRAMAIAAALKMKNSIHFPRNFDEFMVLLDAAHLFFVGDGGVAHIGAALGKKLVTLFGEIDPIQWSPLSKRAKILYHPQDVNSLSNEAIFQALIEQTHEV